MNSIIMKIAFFEIKDWEAEIVKKTFKEHKLSFFTESLNSSNASKAKDAEIISVFIYSKFDTETLKQLPKLKMITTRSTGFDHINVDECKKKGIIVCNVPFYGENTVAEHTFALILALSRNVHKSYMRSIKNDYSTDGLIGFDLYGKTLGVVGAGHIGMHVIRIAKGFGMKVIAFDVIQNKFLSEVLGFEYKPLNDVLKEADIITMHAPYNKHTHHMMNKESFKLMKKDALFINTSRGAIVDTEALLEALNKKLISGAGLDVLEGESIMKEETPAIGKKIGESIDQKIVALDNVVFTPHIAFYSKEALQRILDTTMQNIVDFLDNKTKNCV